MSSAPEETKQELFKRMKRITDSFSIDYSISKEGSTPVQSFKIHFSEKFAPQSINYQCQSNFVAYQLGQIIEREAHIFSAKEAEENKKLYYAHCLSMSVRIAMCECLLTAIKSCEQRKNKIEWNQQILQDFRSSSEWHWCLLLVYARSSASDIL